MISSDLLIYLTNLFKDGNSAGNDNKDNGNDNFVGNGNNNGNKNEFGNGNGILSGNSGLGIGRRSQDWSKAPDGSSWGSAWKPVETEPKKMTTISGLVGSPFGNGNNNGGVLQASRNSSLLNLLTSFRRECSGQW